MPDPQALRSRLTGDAGPVRVTLCSENGDPLQGLNWALPRPGDRRSTIYLPADLLLKTLLNCPDPIAGDVELQDGRVVDDPCQWQLQAVAIPEPVARVAAVRHQGLSGDDAPGPLFYRRLAALGILCDLGGAGL